MKMSKFNIVIYGCDNTGKTTLAEKIKKEFDDSYPNLIEANYVKSLGPAPLYEQVAFLDKNCNNKTSSHGKLQVNIFDRFPIIEEFVCGNILRHENKFDTLGNNPINRYMDTINMFIHCAPGYEMVTNWGTREQMDGIKENAFALYSMYETVKYVFDIKSRTLEFDYTNKLSEVFHLDIVDIVLDFFKGYKTFLKWGGKEK